MRRQVCADGVGVSGIKEQGRHSREAKVVDESLRSVKADITETDFVVPAL